jgi:hypothetical protein
MADRYYVESSYWQDDYAGYQADAIVGLNYYIDEGYYDEEGYYEYRGSAGTLTAILSQVQLADAELNTEFAQTTIVGVIKQGAVEIVSDSTVSCIISHIEGADLSAFTDAQLTAEISVTRDYSAQLNSDSTVAFDAKLFALRSANLTTEFTQTASADRTRLNSAELSSEFSFLGLPNIITLEGEIKEFSATFATEFTQAQIVELTKDFGLDLYVDAVMDSDGVERIRGVDSTVSAEFTQTQTVTRIVQGACDFESLFSPSATIDGVKNTFAILDSTSALAVVAIANRSADIALSSIVNQSLQGDRIRDYAVNLHSEFALQESSINYNNATADLTSQFTQSVVVDKIVLINSAIASQFTQNTVAIKSVKATTTTTAQFVQSSLVTRIKQLSSGVNANASLSATVKRYAFRPNNASSTSFVTSNKATNSFAINPYTGYSDWTYFKTFVRPVVASTNMTQRLITVGNQFYVDRQRVSGVDYIIVNGLTNFLWSGQLANQDYELRAVKRPSPNNDIIDVYFDNTKVGEVDLFYQTFVPSSPATNNVTWSGTFSGSQLASFASGNSSLAISSDLRAIGSVPCWLYWDGTYLNFHTTIGVDNTAGATIWRNLHQRWSGLGIVSGANYTISMAMNNNASYNGALLTLNGSFKSTGGVVANPIIGSTSSVTTNNYYIATHSGGPIGAIGTGTTVTIDNRIFTGSINAVYDPSYPVEYDELLIAKTGFANEVSSEPSLNADDEWKFNSQRFVLGLYHFDNNGIDDIGSDVFETLSLNVTTAVAAATSKIVQGSATLNSTFVTLANVNRVRPFNSNFNSQFAAVANGTKVVKAIFSAASSFNSVIAANRFRSDSISVNAETAVFAEPYDFSKSNANITASLSLTTTPNRLRAVDGELIAFNSQLTGATKIGRGLIGLDAVFDSTVTAIKTVSAVCEINTNFAQTTQAVKTTDITCSQTVTTDFVIDYDKIKESLIAIVSTTAQIIDNSRTRNLDSTQASQFFSDILAVKTTSTGAAFTASFEQTVANLRVRYNQVTAQLSSEQNTVAVKTVNPELLFESIATELVVANKIAFDAALLIKIPGEYRTLLILEENRLLMVPEETRVNMVRKTAQ